MREIKFRWWNGQQMVSHENTFVAVRNIGNLDIIMQFTGLKDKNGIEIYENDVVKDPDGALHIVEYSSNYGFTPIQRPVDYDEIYATDDYWEVVGNVYENPELLEGLE